MSENDHAYFQRRAEVELERAQIANVPRVVQVHFQLAEAYLEKIANAKPPTAST